MLERDTGYHVKGGKEDKRRDRRWRPAGVGDVKVDRQPDKGIEREIRVQHIGEAQ